MRKAILVLFLASRTGDGVSIERHAPPITLAEQAVSSVDPEALAAATALHARGPEGLRAFLDAHDALISELRSGAPARPDLDRVRIALDRVAGQHDAWASGLYWHTDLEQARAEAQASKKPILSLRLLGRLDEELSCANSRFFRTALYANREVSRYLGERYVLHWQSQREAPRMTIDYGDGRVLVRTITGNSLHLVLDGGLEPIDVIPGLVGPGTFLDLLRQDERLAQELQGLDQTDRAARLEAHHRAIAAESGGDLRGVTADVVDPAGAPVPAEVAAPIAMTKMMMERPLLDRLGRRPKAASTRPLLQRLDDPSLQVEAAIVADRDRLDEGSLAVMRRQNAGLSGAKLARLAARFEESMALDSVRNLRVLRPAVHGWIAEGGAVQGLEPLVDRIYAELFLTPKSDPWLGLREEGVYSALADDGVQLSSPAGR